MLQTPERLRINNYTSTATLQSSAVTLALAFPMTLSNIVSVFSSSTFGQHWTTKQIARKATPRAQQRLAVASMLRRLFCSAERVAITDKAYERVAAIATKVGKRMKIAGGAPVTVAQFHAIRALFVERQDALREPLPHDVPPAFVTYVVDGINLLRTEARKRKLAMKVGDQSATLAIVQLLTTGFAPKGVTIIHKVDLVARHMYRASMYSQLANIRCRGQTICARQICRILVTATGDGAWRFPRYTTER